jgi:signal transduction histidine kinase
VILSGLLVRHRLNLLVAIPLTVATLLAVPLVSERMSQVRLGERTVRLAENAHRVSNLIENLQYLRLMSVSYLTGDLVDAASLSVELAAVSDARARTLRELQDPEPTVVQAVQAAEVVSESGPDLLERRLSEQEVIGRVSSVVGRLVDSLALDRQEAVSPEDAWRLAGLFALLKSNEAASEAGAKLLVRANKPELASAMEFDSSFAENRDREYQTTFVRLSSPTEAALFHQAAYGMAAQRLADAEARVGLTSTGTAQPELGPQVFFAVVSQSTVRQIVQTTIARQVAQSARGTTRSALIEAALLAGLAIGLLALVIGLSVAIGRSVSIPLRRLTLAAGEVADVAAEELANVDDDDGGPAAVRRLPELPVGSRDELGELAAAFNRVHATTAQLLERQVVGRRNVSAMFAGIGRRVGNLIGRQLAMIDILESAEEDPGTLRTLYRLDYISTRLRRNASSLVVLSGDREAVADESTVVSLPDAVRAALGSVEDFQRVVLAPLPEVLLAPAVSADVVLILSELIENGVTFSPPHTVVELTAWVTDGACYALTVVDHGIGMPPDRLAEENARLRHRERLDLAPTDVLGLFVVGRVSRRHGIEVTLMPTPGGGVTCRVVLPPSLFVDNPWSSARPTGADPDEQTASVEVDVKVEQWSSLRVFAVDEAVLPQLAAPELVGAEPSTGQQVEQGSGQVQPAAGFLPEGEVPTGLHRRVPGTHWDGPLPTWAGPLQVAPTPAGDESPVDHGQRQASQVAEMLHGAPPSPVYEEAAALPDPEATRRQLHDLQAALAGLEPPLFTSQEPAQEPLSLQEPRPVDEYVTAPGPYRTGQHAIPVVSPDEPRDVVGPSPWWAGQTSPGVLGSGVSGPGASGPGVSGPGVSEPGVLGSGVSGPGASGPGVSGPGVSEPGVLGSGVSGPGVSGPGVSEPGVLGPGVSGPGVSEPGVLGPGVSGPGVSEPGIREPGASEPGALGPRERLVRRVPGATLAALGVGVPESTGPAASAQLEIDPDETLRVILDVDEAVRRARAQGSPAGGGWGTDDAVSRWGGRTEGGGR